MKLIIIAFVVAGLANCGQSHAQNNAIYIDQVGSSNQLTVSQQGQGHTSTLTMGKEGSVDSSSVSVTQQGTGAKTATVELPSGYSNTIGITQDGSGQHTTSILNFTGSANSVSVSQTGAANNTFTVVGGQGTTNSANTITATQSGNAGADKAFTLNMNGTTGASVTVQQTNPTQSNSGSMSINCVSGSCGAYSYIRQ